MPAEDAFADELIDVHACRTGELPGLYGPPCLCALAIDGAGTACHQHVMVAGKVFRTVSHQCWSCTVRLADMAQRGVTRQVLSPMPELLSTWMEPEDGLAMCRHMNQLIAAMVAESPRHFIGLGAVPLQDVDLAIETLDAVLHQHGLTGAEIPGNVNGVPLGDARFKPFFEAAAAWGAAIFVHPLRPTGMDRLVGPPALEQVLAFPGEIGLAGASLITSGLLAELPDLRIALSHGGGSLAMLLPRLRQAWRSLPPVRDALCADPLEQARRLYVDDLVYDAATLRHLVAVFGVERVMAGSDYPFAIMDDDPSSSIDALAVDDITRRALRAGNARRWLGMEQA